MSKHTFTQGEWKAEQSRYRALSAGYTFDWIIRDYTGTTIVTCVAASENGSERPAKENAKLIAASPELLAACQMFLDWDNEEPAHLPRMKIVEAMKSAVKKATE